MGFEDTLGVLAAAGGAVAFCFGVYEYWRAQQWKRSEFVAAEVRAMKEDPSVRTMLQMLDWDGRRADLFPTKEEGRWVLVSHEELAKALRVHQKDDTFSPKEARIRDLADAFLEHLDRFGHFVELELVQAHEFDPYLRYWFTLMFRSNAVWRVPLERFIHAYGYRGVERLAKELEYPIAPASLA